MITCSRATGARPDIVFIVADDLGYADLGCYGGRHADFGAVSPNIDTLAAGGLRFTRGYANAPVCSATRFALMTGRWQYRLRGAAEEPINSRSRGSNTLGLPPEHPTMASLLRDVGYRTALVGKWHLGYLPHFGPLRSGYDEFYGPMSGGVGYFSHCDGAGAHDLWEGEEERHDIGYLTDLLSDRALRVVQQMVSDRRPLLLSLHYTAPHWPWETRHDTNVPARPGPRLFHLDGGDIQSYRRMIHHMDEGIGRVVQALRDVGRIDNSLIIFTSDNGGERFSDNWPLVGGKMDLTEGGIRVPWIAHWPERIAAGGISGQHCMTMDWTATVIDAAGATPAPAYPLDGLSLLSVLTEGQPAFARPMLWRMNHRGQQALRNGRWKYLTVDGNEYLFDVEADERERANLAAREPERLAALREAWHAWNQTMPPIPNDATVSLGYTVADMPQR